MGYGAKKILERMAERKKRKEEKAKLKEEKEQKKKEEKKIEHAKKLKKKRNARAYQKRKSAIDKYRQESGDEKGTFSIYLMKDNKRVKFFVKRRFKNEALQIYYDMLAKNKEEVRFPQKYAKVSCKLVEHKYELVLVKKIDETKEDNVTSLRNEDGKFLPNELIDAPTHKILDKNEWLIEETFQVYGCDPYTDRKTFEYIYNNLIIGNANKSDYTRLMVYNNKLIHHYDDDFDIVVCKSLQQAIDLYDMLEKTINHKEYPSILFMGRLQKGSAGWIIDEMMKKTGWSYRKCKDHGSGDIKK